MKEFWAWKRNLPYVTGRHKCPPPRRCARKFGAENDDELGTSQPAATPPRKGEAGGAVLKAHRSQRRQQTGAAAKAPSRKAAAHVSSLVAARQGGRSR